ncbi:MAG: flagellar hook assembly protein FlgD [Acidobacteriota bacterium]
MSVSYTGASAGILGKAETEYQGARTAGNPTLGKDAFLNLLVTQMKYQDPLNPTSDKEFLAQLAQFSSLEQLTNINASMDKLNTSTTQQQMFSAVSFIGKEVKAKGDSLSKSGNTISTLYYSLPESATKVSINVMDDNGNFVRTVELGAKAAGEQSFKWDGKDWNGKSMPDGVYRVGITTQKADGKSMLVDTTVTGLISGVSNEGGKFLLTTKDGRQVYFTDVSGVVTPESSS